MKMANDSVTIKGIDPCWLEDYHITLAKALLRRDSTEEEEEEFTLNAEEVLALEGISHMLHMWQEQKYLAAKESIENRDTSENKYATLEELSKEPKPKNNVGKHMGGPDLQLFYECQKKAEEQGLYIEASGDSILFRSLPGGYVVGCFQTMDWVYAVLSDDKAQQNINKTKDALESQDHARILSDEEYVAKAGNICPFCQSADVRVIDQTDMTGTDLISPCKCDSCQKWWSDVYRLAGYDPCDAGEHV